MALLNYDVIRRLHKKPTFSRVLPTGFKVMTGRTVSGGLSSLVQRDGQQLVVSRFVVPNLVKPPINLEVTGRIAGSKPEFIDAWVTAQAGASGEFQILLDLYDFRAQQYEVMCSVREVLGTTPSTLPLQATGDVSRFVDGDGTVKARIMVKALTAVPILNWTVRLDEVGWRASVAPDDNRRVKA